MMRETEKGREPMMPHDTQEVAEKGKHKGPGGTGEKELQSSATSLR